MKDNKITLEDPGLSPPLTVRHAPFDWAAQCICWWLEDAFSTCLCHVQPRPWSTATSSSPLAAPAPPLWLPSAAAHPCAPVSAFDSCQTLPRISWSTERCIDRNRKGGERWETVVTLCQILIQRVMCVSRARPGRYSLLVGELIEGLIGETDRKKCRSIQVGQDLAQDLGWQSAGDASITREKWQLCYLAVLVSRMWMRQMHLQCSCLTGLVVKKKELTVHYTEEPNTFILPL